MSKDAAHFTVRDKSLLAKLAAKRLKTSNVAMVIGTTIYLYNVDKATFLRDKKWLRHELMHIEQYRTMGVINFLLLYAYYTVKYGYYNNPLEVEARLAETDDEILQKYKLQ